MNDTYKIIDDFQAGASEIRVLVLDRDFDSFTTAKKWRAVINKKEYDFNLNSIASWITIKSKEKFTGKAVTFI